MFNKRLFTAPCWENMFAKSSPLTVSLDNIDWLIDTNPMSGWKNLKLKKKSDIKGALSCYPFLPLRRVFLSHSEACPAGGPGC